MRKLLFALSAIGALTAYSGEVRAQSTIVVSSCGTLPNQNIPGSTGPIAIDTSGNLCTVLVQTITGIFTQGDIITANNSGQPIDSLKYGAVNGGISLNAASIPLYANCFWNDVDSCVTVNIRARERTFIGNAVLMADASATCCASTWLGTNLTTTAPIYLARDAQFLVMQDRGGVAISGMSRTSDGGSAPRETIGLSGYALMNASGVASEATTGWAAYLQCDSRPVTVTVTQCMGIEIDTVNYGTNQTGDAYSAGAGTHGIWLAAGGAQTPSNPSNSAINILANGTSFNEGIIFHDGGLTKDGNGFSNAISMGQGATVYWYISAGVIGASIRSTISTSGDEFTQTFTNNQVTFAGHGNTTGTFIAQHVANGVNGILVDDAIIGSPALIRAIGSDAAVGIDIKTKTTGIVRVYPATDVAAAFNVMNAALNKTYISVDTSANQVSLPQVPTGTPAASLCLDASNNIIKKTTTGACI